MSGANQNGYAESKRLLLGVGDLYINDVFVGNLKGKVEMKFTRKYAYQRAGNNIADQKAEVTDEELMLDAEVCDIKLSQLRRAFGINEALDTTTAKHMIKRESIKLSGTVAVTLAKTPATPVSGSTVKLSSLDRKTAYVTATAYTLSGASLKRVSGGAIPTGSFVLAEYEWNNASGQSLQIGGESSPPPTFQLDYVHIDSAGKAWQIRLFKAMSITAFAMAFNEVQKGTYTTYAVQFKALVDTTKPEGKNLGEIIEEAPTA
jgi:hypothetical protein